MQNSFSSHHYGCSTRQEIPRLLENLKGDDSSKKLHIKLWTQYTMYRYINKVVCVMCWRLLYTELSIHSRHEPNKKSNSCSLISFQHWNLHYPLNSPKWLLLFRYSKETLYSLLLYYIHTTRHICIIFLATITLISREG